MKIVFPRRRPLFSAFPPGKSDAEMGLIFPQELFCHTRIKSYICSPVYKKLMEKRYETVFILTPVLSDDQAKEAAKKIKKMIADLGAKIINDEHWGLRKLAYPIQKKSTGFYHLIEFSSNSQEIVSNLELQYRRDERIIRFLTVALDKHAAAYAEKRKGRLAEAKNKPREQARTAAQA
jgi:small subunit ribosomal protein S6